MRWLYSAVLAGLTLAVALITPRQVDAQPIRPQPVYPSASPNYSFAPGPNDYPPASTLYGGAYAVMPYGGVSGSIGSTASAYRSAGSSASAPAYPSAGSFSSAPAFMPPPAPPVDVGLYDNSFVPSVLYISAGTVVRWTNRGRNRHTVTSDEGFWDSGELRPGEGHAVFFPLPGRYYYHCKLHARDMRAWVVVRSGY
jgi:plastocyanin